MSEIKVDKITTNNTTRQVTFGTGLEVLSTVTGDASFFETTDYGHVRVFGALDLGSQTGSTTGILNQIVVHGGINNPPRWKTYEYRCPSIDSAAPSNTVYTYMVLGYYEGCTTNTSSFPSAPYGFLYCDGFNGVPDFRKNNPITGQLSFEGCCNGTRMSLNSSMSGPNPSFGNTWTLAYIIKT